MRIYLLGVTIGFAFFLTILAFLLCIFGTIDSIFLTGIVVGIFIEAMVVSIIISQTVSDKDV